MPIDKFAMIKNSRSKVDRLLLAHVSHFANLQSTLDALQANPTSDTAKDVDEHFSRLVASMTVVRNAITSFAQQLVMADEETDEVELDGIEEENGIRLD